MERKDVEVISMERYVSSLSDKKQRQIYIALAKTGMSLDDIVKGMNSRLCDLVDTIDIASVLKGD